MKRFLQFMRRLPEYTWSYQYELMLMNRAWCKGRDAAANTLERLGIENTISFDIAVNIIRALKSPYEASNDTD